MPRITEAAARRAEIPKVSLQTILFDKDKYSKNAAREWLQHNDYRYGNYRQTANEHRFWQRPVIQGARFWSRRDGGIVFVYQQYP